MRYPAILALGLLGGTAGCDLFDNALEVQSPSTIPASTLEIPANAQLLANGAIADFECAVGSYAVMGGEITDELIDATQTADRSEEHTSELQSRLHLVCRLLLEKKKKNTT